MAAPRMALAATSIPSELSHCLCHLQMDQGWHEDPRREDRDPWTPSPPTKEEVITTERWY